MNPRRWSLSLAAVALAAGAAVLLVHLLRPAIPPPEAVDLDTVAPPPEVPRPVIAPAWQPKEEGGTYAGVVVDARDRPVADADVLLVAVDADAKVVLENVDADGQTQTTDLPVFGDYRTAARGKTGADGRFSLAAGGGVRVAALVAYQRGFSPTMRAHTEREPLKPGSDHVLRLSPAGWLKGRVLDATNNAPVARAQVLVYLQHRANQGRRGPDPLTPTNAYSIFQRYVGHVLGPLVWGVEPLPGDTGFPATTTADGYFTFGPVMSEVQVEVVITHPDYMWTDADPEVRFPEDQDRRQGVGRRVRTVVAPGETVEKQYFLQPGKEVRGTVVDGRGEPIPDVEIALEHVAQYAQHPRYRTHARIGHSDAKGKFRIAGLSFDPYVLRMTHPTFDTEFFTGVRAGTDAVYKVAAAGGWIDVTVEDGPTETPQWSGRILVEPLQRGGPTRAPEAVVVHDGKARVERVPPGRYAVTLMSGTKISSPGRAEVRAGEGASTVVRMQAGGSVRLQARGSDGKPVDPSVAELFRVGADGDEEGPRRVAVLVSREGVLAHDGLLPGRYVADLRAPGYVGGKTAPFDVAAGRLAEPGTVVLRRQAYLQITGVSDGDGRPVNVDTAVYVAEGGGEATRRHTTQAGLLPVSPGSVMIRAESADGRRFEQTLDVDDGATASVEIRLSR